MNEFKCLPMKSILQIILSLGLTLFICSSEVCGQRTGKLSDNWVFYMKNYQGEHYYDKSNITYPFNSKSIIRVWETTRYDDRGRNSYILDLMHLGTNRDTITRMGIDKLATMLSQLEIDCKEMRYGHVQVILYDKNGQTLSKYSYSSIERDHSVAKDPTEAQALGEKDMVIERLFKKVCNF